MPLSAWCVPIAGHRQALTPVVMEERDEDKLS
jgi:hypothetical protein